jgi:hypothetical protein
MPLNRPGQFANLRGSVSRHSLLSLTCLSAPNGKSWDMLERV